MRFNKNVMIYTPAPRCEILFSDSPLKYVDQGQVRLDGKLYHIVAELDPDSLKIRLSFYNCEQDISGPIYYLAGQ
jgi:hypothetical protein